MVISDSGRALGMAFSDCAPLARTRWPMVAWHSAASSLFLTRLGGAELVSGASAMHPPHASHVSDPLHVAFARRKIHHSGRLPTCHRLSSSVLSPKLQRPARLSVIDRVNAINWLLWPTPAGGALISAMPGSWFRLITQLLEKGDLTCLARPEGVKKS